ncbi:flavin oxidoreductase [Flagellimonas lutimaris]|uniref:Flavin oxidoreductase n=1 Tax=Flagellimonas lutimaris TaxID=475082 RepID=A0A3A1N9F0_9FLAO|nr:flavin reductase [Allomuricauda lutimaris]RIV30572.1 flavin oxidoreductase [Allomuricauda lutimaris]
MYYSNKDIREMDKVARLKIINSITGIKPANLIGTIDNDKLTNLAVFSSVVHLGSQPPLLGFIARPKTEDSGHTLRNIEQKGEYTINHIHPEFIAQAHYTSAKFDKNISEFDRCGFSEEYIGDFDAPFVKESSVKMGLRLKEMVPIPLNGTTLVIGEIAHLVLPDFAYESDDINLEQLQSTGISGLNSYYKLVKVAQHPYVRVEEVPDFNK